MPTRVFISYSDKDKHWLEQLRTHLAALGSDVEVWTRDSLIPGLPSRQQLMDALTNAQIALLLVSPEFLASDHITRTEVPALRSAAREGRLQLLAIHLRHTDAQARERMLDGPSASSREGVTVSQIEPLNGPHQPLATLRRADRDRVMVEIVRGVTEAVKAIGAHQELHSVTELHSPQRQRHATARSHHRKVVSGVGALLGITVVCSVLWLLKPRTAKNDAPALSGAEGLSVGPALIERLHENISLEMMEIPAGDFTMGSTVEPDEQPQRRVRVASFLLGRVEVTQAQWFAVSRYDAVARPLVDSPSQFPEPNRPVEGVSWYDATEFCARLARKTRRPYRLPTEAEWEYAARAGTTTPFSFGDVATFDLANYDSSLIDEYNTSNQSRRQTIRVGSLRATNKFGLSDMHGNVWEWVRDTWHADYIGAPAGGRAREDPAAAARVIRGGSWSNAAKWARSASRAPEPPGRRLPNLGFRVACSISAESQ